MANLGLVEHLGVVEEGAQIRVQVARKEVLEVLHFVGEALGDDFGQFAEAFHLLLW